MIERRILRPQQWGRRSEGWVDLFDRYLVRENPPVNKVIPHATSAAGLWVAERIVADGHLVQQAFLHLLLAPLKPLNTKGLGLLHDHPIPILLSRLLKMGADDILKLLLRLIYEHGYQTRLVFIQTRAQIADDVVHLAHHRIALTKKILLSREQLFNGVLGLLAATKCKLPQLKVRKEGLAETLRPWNASPGKGIHQPRRPAHAPKGLQGLYGSKSCVSGRI